MSLVFYYAPQSTAVTVNWALEELGIPYEKVEIDLAARDQDKPGYRALDPNGRVPLVVHDGVPIFESAAIMIHLGETFGVERDLFPAPGLERAEALKWLVWANATLAPAILRFLQQRSPETRGPLDRLLGVLDGELQGKRYVLGGTFSLVDVHLASFARWLEACGVELATWPALHGWKERCVARPSHDRAQAA